MKWAHFSPAQAKTRRAEFCRALVGQVEARGNRQARPSSQLCPQVLMWLWAGHSPSPSPRSFVDQLIPKVMVSWCPSSSWRQKAGFVASAHSPGVNTPLQLISRFRSDTMACIDGRRCPSHLEPAPADTAPGTLCSSRIPWVCKCHTSKQLTRFQKINVKYKGTFTGSEFYFFFFFW